MKLWSRGLGKTELNMDFRYYKVKKDLYSDNVFIIGKITDPVDWEFKITLGPEDIPGMTKIFFNFGVIKLLIKNFVTNHRVNFFSHYYIFYWRQ